MTFSFDEERHMYLLDDEVIPSLSTILYPAAWESLSHVPDPEVLEKARVRGVDAHLDTELFDREQVDKDYSPYAQAWAQFREDSGFEPLEIEQATYHTTMRYGCKPDRFGIQNGKFTVIDLKTSGKEWWHPIQTVGQAAALSCHPDHGDWKSMQRMSVYLLPRFNDRQYDVSVHQFPEEDAKWLHWYWWGHIHKKLGRRTDGDQ